LRDPDCLGRVLRRRRTDVSASLGPGASAVVGRFVGRL
jgi:hypothetical protein